MEFKPYLEFAGDFAGYINAETYISDAEGNTLYYGDAVLYSNEKDRGKYIPAVMIERNGLPVPSCSKEDERPEDYNIRKMIDVLRQNKNSAFGVNYVYKDPKKTPEMILADKLLEVKTELVNLTKRNDNLRLEQVMENISYAIELLTDGEDYV